MPPQASYMGGMSNFDETQHPRAAAGTFTNKPQSAPDVTLPKSAHKPQEPGEVIVWLVEGDDHEMELIEAVTEHEALEEAAELFGSRYEDDEDDEDERVDIRDLLTIVGTFRGEVGDYSDELEFVPTGNISESEAYANLRRYS